MTEFEPGVYEVRFPCWWLLRPKIKLWYEKDKGKWKGVLRWLKWKIWLKLLKQEKNSLLFQLTIDVVELELILYLTDQSVSLDGLIDTPIGNLTFQAVRKNGIDYEL